ncbi:uncharacterized protein LOC125681968 isoform X4 [Ostrea edulis]|uniref:uncharacterized protein LOC125681968 isoform X4 n=1 Tax=Ostrea edulis TaxID=37623 RepID=UPI0024AF4AE3|nr:uncharacterized protein LOC125681968 isoform X4 [Ostrea edulis]XP_056010526.1 uncharacterized protein LOC125681968 isoform X4 [Ostrea edulis]
MRTIDIPQSGGMGDPKGSPDSGISSLIEVSPCESVQRAYIFLRDHLHEEEQLIGYLCIVCGRQQLTDDERVEMREGGGCSNKEKLLKQLIHKGNEPCKEFLEKLKACDCFYTRFCQTVESRSIIEYQPEVDLTAEKLEYHEDIIIEEMESSRVSNILLSLCILSVADHDEIEKETTRKLKAKKLIEKIRSQQDKIRAFYHTLEVTHCDKALQYIKDNVCRHLVSAPSESIRCVRFNYRNLLFEFEKVERRKIAFYSEKMQNFRQHFNELPKENHFVKTGLRKEKLGCDSLLRFLEWIHNGFLYQMAQRLQNRKQEGRERLEQSISFERIRNLKDFLLEELEPMPVSNVLLEEEAFSVDDHDAVEAVEGMGKRRRQSEIIYNRLLADGSERTLESFLFALKERKLKHILDNFDDFRSGQMSNTEPRNQNDDPPDLQIVPVGGMQIPEDLESRPDLDMMVSIPFTGDERALQQVVDQIENDHDLRVLVAELSHLEIRKVQKGSVVLHLIPLTDDACVQFLDEKGKCLKQMVERLLIAGGIKEEMIKGNISVTVFVNEKENEAVKDKQSIGKMKVRENWNLLEEELEPSSMVHRLKVKGILKEDEEKNVLKQTTRRGKVNILLKTLMNNEREDAIDKFIEALKGLGKSEIASQIQPKPDMHEEAEKVRRGLLCKFQEVIDEIESSIMEDTLKRCDIDPGKELSSGLGKSRKERAYNFLISVMLNDVYILALKDVLEYRGLHELVDLQEETELSSGTKRKHPENIKVENGSTLFECQYKIVKKEEKCYSDVIRKRSPAHKEMMRDTPETPVKKPDLKPLYTRKKKDLQPKRTSVHSGHVTGKTYGRPCLEKTEDDEWSIVVALDFGTTYSGFAFWRKENPSEIMPRKWKTNATEVLESLKTPTSLLLNKSNELIEFGFEAERVFKELVEDEFDSDYRFFSKFKMKLHHKKSLDAALEIRDHLGHPMKAIDLFSIAIGFLKEECTDLLTKKNMMVADDEIQWILTVPAIWDEFAKQFMRKAAETAGVPSHQLKLALEPEVAAIYVIKESKTVLGKKSLSTYEPGTQVMLADLGGGTADFTVLELTGDRKMKQLYRAFGGEWGGNMINQKVWEVLVNIFGRDVIEAFKNQTADSMEMEYNIEIKKRVCTPESQLQLPIFPSLTNLCQSLKKKTYKELVKDSRYADIVKVRTGKLVFTPEMVEQIFEMALTNLFVKVDKVLKNPNTTEVKDIILVGGFAQSEVIVKQFKRRFSKYQIIIPTDPELAVMKGAVMFGQDINIITSRISPHTYGFDVMHYFQDGSDPQNKRKKIDGTPYCYDIFEKMVAIGESVDVGKTVEKEVFASASDMTKMSLKFYQSDIENPQFVTDPGCECIGELLVDMPDKTGGTERSVMVSIKFGETEIMVCGVDRTTGKRQETKLDLLGKNC